VDGKPSKNPRYLQKRPDLVNPRESYLAEMAARLRRRVPLGEPLHTPVNAVLPGRRNNPPEGGHPFARVLQPDPLFGIAGAVHGIHLQHDRQIAVHDRRGFGRRADQRPVQRAAADH
jgi:hypothetical protein